jgi:hypothetical protein
VHVPSCIRAGSIPTVVQSGKDVLAAVGVRAVVADLALAFVPTL